MKESWDERLNYLVEKLSGQDFLSGKGIANEISFHIFPYPADQELAMRDFIRNTLRPVLENRHGLKVGHVDLFELVLTYLERRKLLDKVLASATDGRDALARKNLSKVVTAEKLRPLFLELAQPEQHQLVLVTGVGSVYPMLRAHNLLNNAQADMGRTPLVLFYPGTFSGQDLRLFDQSTLSNNYYRAFHL